MSDKVVSGLNDNDIASLIALLDSEVGEPILPRPDGFGITVKEYATQKGCGEEISRRLLEKAVKDGVLAKKQMTNGMGSSPYVYYKP